ncbi:hypothetical protein CQW23_08298 [Capsicum baccatum]|uniref:Uncharacterized protein n=1 Tax=Capsicum baccatum TaxID=33114 RepID=A0A2G2X8L0_CAPBA|nr:hypothetical protein CQW23_08298 [Capsicum baccatum]
MDFDPSSKQDVFCTIPTDYLHDFHHLDLTFSLAGGPLTFNTNPDHMIEMDSGYEHPLFDPLSNHGDNFSSMGQDFNFGYEFKPFEQNGNASGSTLFMKNFESSTDMKSINFNVVRDESSCVTSTIENNGTNNVYNDKEIGGRKNKKLIKSNDKKSSSMRKSGRGTRKKSKSAKGQWTIEEDRILINLVEKFGDRKWSEIAKMLKGRIGKQCRERWNNHLRPDIKMTKRRKSQISAVTTTPGGNFTSILSDEPSETSYNFGESQKLMNSPTSTKVNTFRVDAIDLDEKFAMMEQTIEALKKSVDKKDHQIA